MLTWHTSCEARSNAPYNLCAGATADKRGLVPRCGRSTLSAATTAENEDEHDYTEYDEPPVTAEEGHHELSITRGLPGHTDVSRHETRYGDATTPHKRGHGEPAQDAVRALGYRLDLLGHRKVMEPAGHAGPGEEQQEQRGDREEEPPDGRRKAHGFKSGAGQSQARRSRARRAPRHCCHWRY
jgi:hypothetical protein